MAQVTMDSKEYLELIAAQRELERIKKDMVAGFRFEYQEDAWQNYRCSYTPSFPEDVKEHIAEVVVKACVDNPELMERCWQDSMTVFDTGNMLLTRNWGTKDRTLVDLTQYPDFLAAYNKYTELNIVEEEM